MAPAAGPGPGSQLRERSRGVCVCVWCVCVGVLSLLYPLLLQVKLMAPAQFQCTEPKRVELAPGPQFPHLCFKKLGARVPSNCSCEVLRLAEGRESLGKCFV